MRPETRRDNPLVAQVEKDFLQDEATSILYSEAYIVLSPEEKFLGVTNIRNVPFAIVEDPEDVEAYGARFVTLKPFLLSEGQPDGAFTAIKDGNKRC